MQRAAKLLTVMVVALASFAGVAQAAASPTVITGTATSVTDTTAVLHARVDPNGSPTDFLFNYGPTVAYGIDSTAQAVGSGGKAVDVAQTITGLTPGTTYHYRIFAQGSTGGGAFGADATFTTTGFPPASVITGPAAGVGATVATPTGTINPEGGATTWAIQYGLTPIYTFQTLIPESLPAGLNQPQPVSVQIVGLAPATLFHYRLVAYHADSASLGLDQTFFTEPQTPPQPRLTATITPSTAAKSPYTFTTVGTVRGDTWIPAAQRCTGNIGIRFYNGRRQLAFVVAPVGSDCTFSQKASFKRYFGSGPTSLRVTIYYRGNGYLAAVSRVKAVTVG